MTRRDTGDPPTRAIRADIHRAIGFHPAPIIYYSEKPVGIVYAATLRRRRRADDR